MKKMADQTDRQKRLLRRRRRLSSAVLPPVVEVNDANKRCELTVEWQEREAKEVEKRRRGKEKE